MTKCRIPECAKAVKPRHSLCSMHQARLARHGDPQYIKPPVDYEGRFWSKVVKTNQCWLWEGTVLGNGYGQFSLGDGRRTLAHRYAYVVSVGPIPEGLTIDHLCRNIRCVNPQHLEPVSGEVNLKRRWAHVRSNDGRTA